MQTAGESLSALDRLTGEEMAALLRGVSAPEVVIPVDMTVRPAAVLLPLLRQDGQWHLLFTRRTESVQSHKGQVSFPGGGAEPQDASPVETALRESFEEIGLAGEDVQVLGRLPDMVTNSSFLISPVVGVIRWPVLLRLSPDEVGRIFTIPLRWLAEKSNREERPRINRLGLPENVVYFQTYDGELLWGITARITVNFLKILGYE
jgi:8-oxo-dGTP pyrophosphatase MutT (NUDIX family)